MNTEEREEKIANLRKAADLMKLLDIPCYDPTRYYVLHINVVELYHILMDEEKLKTLVSKLKLKAFW